MLPRENQDENRLHQELLDTLHETNRVLKGLSRSVRALEQHEFVNVYNSKWRLVLYQLGLGMLFAVGTVMGLVFLSWLTFTYFKDSQILRDIVQNQLRIRQFDLPSIRERALEEADRRKSSTASIVPPYTSTKNTTKSGSTK